MEEGPENGKESMHSAHANGMNTLKLCQMNLESTATKQLIM
jgi:hypothetical protein